VRVATVAGVFVAIVGAYALWFRSVYGHLGVENRDGYFLYGRVQAFADCNTMEIPTYEQRFCDLAPVDERPSANYYVWDHIGPSHTALLPRGVGMNHALAEYAKRAIRQQPLDYAGRVATDFVDFFRPGRVTGRFDEPGTQWLFPLNFDRPTSTLALSRKFDHSRPRVTRPLALIARGFQKSTYPEGPLLAVLVVLSLFAIVPRGRTRRTSPEAALLAASGLAVLIVAVATVMFDYRYLLPALPFLGVAAALGLQTFTELHPAAEEGLPWFRRPHVRRLLWVGGVAAVIVGGASLAFTLAQNRMHEAQASCRIVRNGVPSNPAAVARARAEGRSVTAEAEEAFSAAQMQLWNAASHGGRPAQLHRYLTGAIELSSRLYGLERGCKDCARLGIDRAEVLAIDRDLLDQVTSNIVTYCGDYFPST